MDKYGRKTGGRKKGTPNKCRKHIDFFVEKMFSQVDMIQKGRELLEHKDPRVQASVWCRLMDYKFGKPRDQLVISGEVDMHHIVAAARARVLAGRQQRDALVPVMVPAKDTLELAEAQPTFKEWTIENGLERPPVDTSQEPAAPESEDAERVKLRRVVMQ